MAGRKPKRGSRLSLATALARIDAMRPLIQRDIDIAMAEYGALESGNALISEQYKGIGFAGAATYNVIHQALTHSLSLRVAKLLETPIPRNGTTAATANNRSDLASLPLDLRLIGQVRCANVFASRARTWTPQLRGMEDANERACREAIDRAMIRFRAFSNSPEGKLALEKLKRFRNHMLAHNLLSQANDHVPTYDQLYLAFHLVLDLWHDLRLATTGVSWDGNEFVRVRNEEGNAFWGPALEATIATRQAAF